MNGLAQEQRKLAAIMFTDMVGYSASVQANESLALELLEEHRRLLRAIFPRYDGREIETAGDAFFVEFASALNAVRCAVEIQDRLHARNMSQPRDRHIRIRIGLHVGDVVVRGNGVLGDGVNIAARLEPLAPPEGICISEDVARQVRNKIDHPLRKLGKAELKNIQLPVEIYLIDLPWSETASPPQTAAQQDIVLNNLPAQPTLFLGRDNEMLAVQNLLRQESVRLVTLTGPGGTGKTRLGLRVAESTIGRFRNGACFVVLAPVSDPGLVVSEIARALGVRDTGAKPLLDLVKEFLRELQLLLFIDNFEQVVTAAPIVGELLAHCPGLKAIVTSREPLHLSAEQEFLVPPLDLPNLKKLPPSESLSQYASVALFIQRAGAVKPGFTLTNDNAPAVAEICHRLDGLPLAIELAAARMKLLTPQAILERLGSGLELLQGGARDKPERHQTLRRAIEWSYELLGRDEKAIFRRLAVMAGGCSLESAEAVCNVRNDIGGTILDGIAALVDKSLLRQDPTEDGQPRFHLLETIREFALEMLRASDEWEDTCRAHAEYFVKLAEKAELFLTGPEQQTWLDVIEREHDNMRAAFTWAETSGAIGLGVRLGASLWRFWVVRGYMGEGRERLFALLQHPGARKRTGNRAKALNGLGTIMHEQGDYGTARPVLEESLAIARELDDKKGIATVLNNLSAVHGLMGDIRTSVMLSEESMAIHRELGDKRGVAVALNNIASAASPQLDIAAQISMFKESLELRLEVGDERGAAYMTTNIGWCERSRGNYSRAIELANEALTTLQRLGDIQISAWALSLLGDVARHQGDLAAAERYLSEGTARMEQVGNKFAAMYTSGLLGAVALKQGNAARARELLDRTLEQLRSSNITWENEEFLCQRIQLALREEDLPLACQLLAEALDLAARLDSTSVLAVALECGARIALHRKDFLNTSKLLASTLKLREEVGMAIAPNERPFYDGAKRESQSALGEVEFAAAWQAGKEMSPEQLSTLARSLAR